MNLLNLTYPLNGLLMILMPVGLAIYLTRKFRFSWRLWWIGGFTFILSQVAHIPFNLLLLNPLLAELPSQSLSAPLRWLFPALALGLSAGLFEGLARYAMYRWWARDARSFGKGLLAGAGHGGMEAILLGVLALYAFIQLFSLQGVDLSTIVPSAQLSLAQQQVASYWSANWFDSLLGSLERLFAIPVQISASLLVLQVFTRNRSYWLALAILWHAFVDASLVFAAPTLGAHLTEALLGFYALISLLIIFALRQPEPVSIPTFDQSPLPQPLTAAALRPVEEDQVSLEHTRYDQYR